MTLKHLVVPESKEVLTKPNKTKSQTHTCAHTEGDLSTGHRSPQKELQITKAGEILATE